jgi:CHAD domain-containing protein
MGGTSLFSRRPEKDFSRYSRKRLRQFKRDFKTLMAKADPESLHDFRRKTRQLQTIVETSTIRHASRQSAKIRRRLKKSRHVLSEWRDANVMLGHLKNRRRQAPPADKAFWSKAIDGVTNDRQHAAKKFRRVRKSLGVNKIISQTKTLFEKKSRFQPLTENLQLLLKKSWQKCNESIDDFVRDATVSNLHQVRIKAKTFRNAIALNQRFYPDNRLERASMWLKRIQDSIGGWHDELILGLRASETLSRPRASRDRRTIKLIRLIKEREIILAESALKFIKSIRTTREYRQLRRVLSASIFAMTNYRNPTATDDDSISGALS